MPQNKERCPCGVHWFRGKQQPHAKNVHLSRNLPNWPIGMGHFMRCLALAQTWIETGERAIFAMTKTNPTIDSLLRAAGADVVMTVLSSTTRPVG